MIRYREPPTPDGTFGTFPEDDFSETYQTLEPGDDELIPAGTFTMLLVYSPGQGHAIYEYQAVPGHSHELIHSLNVWKLWNGDEQSEGCTGVGDSRGPVEIEWKGDTRTYPHAIRNSRATLNRFMARRGCPNFRDLTSPEAVAGFLQANPAAERWRLTVIDGPVPVVT